MICCKVTNNAMLSYYAIFDAEVQYRENEWAQAPEKYAERGWHLFVFDTLESAKKFLFDDPNAVPPPTYWEKIWECECEDEVPIPKNFSALTGPDFEMAPLYDRTFTVPEGTMMFKRVKLIKRIS